MLINFSSQTSDIKGAAIRVFYSYSHKDEDLRDTLEEHLTVLKRQGFISTWHDRKLMPGDEWKGQIDRHLEEAQIILLLISSSFVASDYCYDCEMARALQRHDAGKAIVIPVILRPVFWQILPLARLHSVPKDGKPITTYKIQDEAFVEVAEAIRNKVSQLQSSHTVLSITEEHRWHWVLRLHGATTIDKQEIASILAEIRSLVHDPQVEVAAFGDTKNVIVLSGSKEGFASLDQLIKEGKVKELGRRAIQSFYLIYGAGIKTTSEIAEPGTESLPDDVNQYGRLIYRSRVYTPVLTKGIFVPAEDATKFEFIVDTGDVRDQALGNHELQRIISYFVAGLAANEDDLWVNLSAYEGNRMIPKVLEGTRLGRDLLDQDCVLKQLTASLVHPDTEIGRAYWNAVYARANRLFGTTRIPISTFQKVWLFPDKAQVYETKLPHVFEPTDAEFLRNMSDKHGRFAYVTDGRLSVACEEDYVALRNHHAAGAAHEPTLTSKAQELNDFTLPIFREIVLPVIQEEVNTCINFTRIRQIYFAMILAKWYREMCADMPSYERLVETGNASAIQPTISSIVNIGLGSESSRQERKTSFDASGSPLRGLELADDEPTGDNEYASMDVKENREFYEKYIDLFKRGSFAITRREIDEYSGTIVNRRYFSGMVRFSTINLSTVPLIPTNDKRRGFSVAARV